MAVTYKGSRIFYQSNEPTGSTLTGFSGTYTPYDGNTATTGMIKISGTNYYVAGCASSKTTTYITQLIYHTDTPIASFDFTSRCATDNTDATYQRRIVVSTSSTVPNSYTSFATMTGFALRYTSATIVVSCTGLTIPAGTFYVYIGPGSNDTSGKYSTIWGYGTSYAPSISNVVAPTAYTISYNANGGSGTMANQTKYAGINLTLRTNSFTAPESTETIQTITLKNGSTTVGTKTTTNTTPKDFNEWNTNSAGTGTSYNAGASYTANADATMYAQWVDGTMEKERIVLGSTTKSPTSSSLTLTLKLQDGLDITYPLTKTINYTFKNWNTRTNDSGTKFDSTTHYSFVTDAILYAIFDSSEVLPTVNLPTNIIRDGYTFKGWSANSTGSPLINGNTYQPSSDTTLYAVWEGSGIEDGMYVYQASDQAWHKVASFTI